ncbi:MAG: cobyrinate a,c-diamide synthase [Lachnospiraceae bacterium]|nr:cobyrinate a,c-diamide synthase [Lachnospiraceae bacterium]
MGKSDIDLCDKNRDERPRVMIAAVSSGSGKTTVTCALLEALKRRGHNPVSFKCGPDYIDPMFHRKVLEIDSLNLDSYFMSDEEIIETLGRYGGDISVIEGVMGIYDGIDTESDRGSCYEIAGITNTPVILVVNAAGSGRTIASVIKGVLSDDTEHLIRGIIINRISDNFYNRLLPYLEGKIAGIRDDVSIIGHIPDNNNIHIDSRHLGLTLPQEIAGVRDIISKAAGFIEANCDIGKIMEIAQGAVPVQPVAFCKQAKYRTRKIAVASDEAFCFYYPQNIGFLREIGFEPVYFSPLRDKHIPEGVDALLLGGGYPELHLKELSRNTSMLESIRSAIGSGMPSLAECGGFMYLHKAIEDKDGRQYMMAGVVDGICSFSGRLVNFGYTQVSGYRGGSGGKKGGNCSDWRAHIAGMRGHEFHYYESTCEGTDLLLRKASTDREYRSMHAGEDHMWGFAHFYYPSAKDGIARLLGRALNI